MAAAHSQDAFYDDAQALANVEAKERKAAGPDKSLQNLTALFDQYAGELKAPAGS